MYKMKRRRIVENNNSQIVENNNGQTFQPKFSDAIRPYITGDYTEWSKGSTLLFWRWSSDTQDITIHGIKPWIKGELPQNKRKARKPSPEVNDKILSKVSKYLQRGYLRLRNPGEVINLIDYFGVKRENQK